MGRLQNLDEGLDGKEGHQRLRPGRNRALTRGCKRNATTGLFAALSVATGEVLAQTREGHTGKDVLAFFKWIDLHTPRPLTWTKTPNDIPAKTKRAQTALTKTATHH